MSQGMTGRERLLAAIRHREPDRLPIAPRIWAYLIPYYVSGGWAQVLRATRIWFRFLRTAGLPDTQFHGRHLQPGLITARGSLEAAS